MLPPKGFVYLAEADLARAAAFLGMTRPHLSANTSTAPETACACECRAIPGAVPAPRRLLHPSGETHPMPHLSILAGTAGKPPGMEQNRPLVPGIGKGRLIRIESARAQAREMREAYPALY